MAEEKAAAKAAAKADDGPAKAEEAADGAKGAKGPLIPPIMIRFSILGGILVVMAVGAIFLVTDVIAPRLKRLGEPVAPAAEEAHAAPPEAHHAATELVTISDLVVNPAGSGGRRYLKVAAAIEVTVPETKGKKKAKEAGGAHGAAGAGAAAGGLQDARLRDLLIRELSARTLEELTDPASKEEARLSIMAGLEEILGSGRVAAVYFTEYVIQ